MKTMKKLVSVLLAVVLAASMVLVAGAAITFTDTETHWAWTQGYIPYLVEKNVLNGYPKSDGTYYFKPDGEVTRAEFIKMLDETFGLTETKAVSFSDVTSSDWFNVYFQKAAAQGYLLDYGTKCEPNGKITREEAISLLVRYLALDSTQKAPESTFADFSTIKQAYRDYILEAIYAGLTDGYKQSDGSYVFKPTKTLSRAEALTILYRAAGCIYNANSYQRDVKAANTNNVITKGGITIYNQTLTGRTIITEGAASDIVAFSNCTIEGTLIIRGDAKVYFDSCKVNAIVDNGNGGISLMNGSAVNDITLYDRTALNIDTTSAVKNLNVTATASYCSVIGEGAIEKLTLKASGFTSTIVPNEYDIAQNISATIDGTTYTGNGENNTPFTVIPYVASDKTYYYIEFTSSSNGSLYYYYTNTEKTPSTADFDSNYRTAACAGRIAVTANKATSQKIDLISNLSGFKYVVLMLQEGTTKYAPFVIDNSTTSNTGFTTDPVYDETANTLTVKTSAAGTVYWYYTSNAAQVTPTEFSKNYDATETALKGTFSVAVRTPKALTVNATYAKTYQYIALQLKGAAGAQYAPIVVAISANGFTTVPEIKTAGVVSFVGKESGTLYYYYAKTNAIPTPEKFETEYKAATYSNYLTFTAGKTVSFNYQTSYAGAYPYMILAIKTTSGFKLPVALELGYESGFATDPRMTSDTTFYFRTASAGTVQYYYTTSAVAPTVDAFTITFKGIMDSSTQKGSFTAYTALTEGTVTIPTGLNSSWYVVIMFTDKSTNVSYAPMVLSLKYSPETNISGFSTTPVVKNGVITLTPTLDGTIYYYYTASKTALSVTDFYNGYTKAANGLYGSLPAVKNTASNIIVNASAKTVAPYIAICIQSGGIYCDPIVINAFTDTVITASYGFNVQSFTDGILHITPLYSGTLYYYLTDSTGELPTTTFLTGFASPVDVTENVAKAIESNGKKYIVMCMKVGEQMLDFYIYDTGAKGAYTAAEYNDGATTNITGMTYLTSGNIFNYVPSENGYVYYTLVGDGNVINYGGSSLKGNVGSQNAVTGVQNSFDFTSVASGDYSSYQHVYLYVQLFVLPLTTYKSVVITIK